MRNIRNHTICVCRCRKTYKRHALTSAIIQQYQPVKELVKDLFLSVKQYVSADDPITGIPTGLANLDHITGGLKPAHLYLIAAQPIAGKTSLAMNITFNAATQNETIAPVPVALFSLDETKAELMEYLISMAAGIEFDRVRTGNVEESDWEKLTAGAGRLYDTPLFIDDTPLLANYELCTQIRRITREQGIKVVIIDYVQLLQDSDRSEVCRKLPYTLKQLAQELRIAIIAVSQLRPPQEGGNRRPRINDLGRFQSFKQHADVIMFLHRKRGADVPTELIVAKNCNGIGTTEIRFISETGRYVDVEN